MEARNRNLKDWMGKVRLGEIKLPRFQRYEAWDRHRICSLIDTVIHNLPLGITLILDVGDAEKFVSRYLETAAPTNGGRVQEQLLDGQQRLTALWRAFHNNYEWDTYFVYFKDFDKYEGDEERDDLSVFFRSRYIKKNGDKYPLWCDNPADCLRRGFIPTNLFKPEDIQSEIDSWIDAATADLRPKDDIEKLEQFLVYKKTISDRIKDLRAIIANYNLPYLSLPSQTDKSTALDVFIKMNTNSQPLSQYDIIVAEVEDLVAKSLHDLQDELHQKHPRVSQYADLSDLILTASALLQDALPNQRGAWDMDKRLMVAKWDQLETSLNQMAEFLSNEGIHDRQRLPTNAVLAVIAALYAYIPSSGDKRGQDELLLKKYLWHSFFTDRYENAAATRAFADFMGLKRVISNNYKEDGSPYTVADIPIFSDHKQVEIEELLTVEWPKNMTIRGRGILAVACRLGAFDFSTGTPLNAENIAQRQYHHIYPDALLKEANIDSFLALNCALISDKTNFEIGRKDPVEYLKDRYKWVSHEIVSDRLQSHVIPVPELANGGYEGLAELEKKEKLKKDFGDFLKKRAELIMKAVQMLAEGRPLSASVLFQGIGAVYNLEES